ncbi:MAG: phage Gp37/Gp68 family protein, partial [Candidatus Bathyarchaeota archaeon]|nr:phage Gp37/Gp68 family protein [Candidatus Bathyarchaeota archaeon]
MDNRGSSSETFGEITETWNPITGCLHNCVYCWARGYASRLASMGVKPYNTEGFKPAFAEWRLKQRLPRGRFFFVSDMGDMWGEWVPKKWIERVLGLLRSKFNSRFLFLTKNPGRYREFRAKFAQNMMLGATIETNRDYRLTKAPPPRERYEAMRSLDWKHKALVIEPILDFDH